MEVSHYVKRYCAVLGREVDILEHYSVEPTGSCPINVNLSHWQCEEENHCRHQGVVLCALIEEYEARAGM